MLKHLFALVALLSFVLFIAIGISTIRYAQTIDKEYSLALTVTTRQPRIENNISVDSDGISAARFNSDKTTKTFNKEEINFVSTMQNPPNCTTLSFPLGNATAISSSLGLITWEGVSNAASYRITVSGSESNVNDVSDLVITGISYSFNNSFTPGETVSVTVVPFNNDGDAIGCTAETFTIIGGNEDQTTCTSLNSPINGATGVSVNVGFDWDEVPGATGYLIAIQTEGGEFILPETDLGRANSFNLPDALPFATSVLVGVTAYDTDGASVACIFSIFRTRADPATVLPSCTQINSPLPEATNIPVNTRIRWNAVGNVGGYILSMGTTEGGTDILDNFDIGLGTSYVPEQNLPFDQEIFVTVLPYLGTLIAENCTSQSFTTAMDPQQEGADETLYGFSPNGDNINDFWKIEGIDLVPDNTVTIYNRWGDIVFQTKGYDNRSNSFDGTANKKTKMGANELPSGTYFFNIEVSGTHNLKKLQGYVVIRR